jgi:hypothetical protein
MRKFRDREDYSESGFSALVPSVVRFGAALAGGPPECRFSRGLGRSR